mgnify:FL=1
MAAPPKWAQSLCLDALTWWERQGHTTPNPSLTWRRGSSRQSSGRANDKSIVVTAGTYRTDAKMVLLHEMAHTFTGVGHTDLFWDTAWALYRWAKLPIRYCRTREGTYRRGSLAAYARSVTSRRALP